MDMKTFLKNTSPDEREALANRLGTSVAYFWQIAGGHRKPSALLCRRLEAASGGLISAAELRPELFGSIDPFGSLQQ
jgi:DNA-binding transcriptional regulator YdaS (Cro superfamily)